MNQYKHTEAGTRVLRAIANMPYGALVTARMQREGLSRVGRNRHGAVDISLDDVANYLETLSAVLTECYEHDSIELGRLRKMEQDVEGMRRVLGGAK